MGALDGQNLWEFATEIKSTGPAGIRATPTVTVVVVSECGS
jgi:hypothetical protein